MVQITAVELSGLGQQAYEALYTAATPERKARADRFRSREDALRCLAAGALLGKALGEDARHLETGPYGKPCVKGRPGIHFNLSHSGAWVVLALSSQEVGIDVERMALDEGRERIARRYFTPEEQDYIFAEREDRQLRFYRIWCGKESWLKYRGTGLSGGLTGGDVLRPEEGLYFHTRLLPGGYFLSLCSGSEKVEFRQLDWEELLT